ncbi:hypothetical protein ACFL5G_05385 [Candidatus Margulisiibacteriota bacterium]
MFNNKIVLVPINCSKKERPTVVNTEVKNSILELLDLYKQGAIPNYLLKKKDIREEIHILASKYHMSFKQMFCSVTRELEALLIKDHKDDPPKAKAEFRVYAMRVMLDENSTEIIVDDLVKKLSKKQ